MYDLHLHSTYSDGDQQVADVVAECASAGLVGISVTDHNGLWGQAEAASAAAERGLEYLPGIEISARAHGADLHIIGYSYNFDQRRLEDGLANTRDGYERRARRMLELCDAVELPVAFEELVDLRAAQHKPVYMAYDVARLLSEHHGLSGAEAKKLTTHGGKCHVPYGEWALSPAEAVTLIHGAGGIAVFAHPGTVSYEAGDSVLESILAELVAAEIDGIEVYHPFHDSPTKQRLKHYSSEHNLLVTGGSDWHGPGRYHEGALGSIGLSTEGWQLLTQRLQSLFPQDAPAR